MKTLLVHCHPLEDSYVAELRRRALAGLHRAGHEVREIDLYADGFQPELTRDEHRNYLDLHERRTRDDAPLEIAYVEALRWCEALVLVYPTWWSGQPAMLKGWFDRILVRGVAFELPDGGNRVRPLLTNIRRLVVITSHGSAKWVNAVEGEGGKRVVSRAIRALCHRRCRTTWLALYKIDRASEAERTAFLARVEDRMRRLAG